MIYLVCNVYNCNINANKERETNQINIMKIIHVVLNEQSISLALEACSFHFLKNFRYIKNNLGCS